MMFLLPQNVLKIFDFLKDFEVYLIGGCVRDLLLHNKPKDFDFTTQATPKEMLEIFQKHKIKTIDIGIEFGTIALLLDNEVYEITTFREESVYKNFRKPESIKFSLSLLEDTKRRDFTCNAIAYHPQKGIIDYHNGQQDLKNKILRAIGDPKQRFLEDALRILRAIGFASRFDFEIEELTKQSMLENRELLSFISKERITAEWEKMLNAPFFAKTFPQFSPIFEVIFKDKISLPQKLSSDFCLRNAQILKDSKKLDFINLSKAKKEEIKAYMQWQISTHFKDKIAIKKMLSLYPREWVEKFLVQDEEKYKILQEIFEKNETYKIKDLKVNGSDLLAFKGKQRGEVLQDILDKVIRGELKNQREELLKHIARKLNSYHKATRKNTYKSR
ncbi:MULTISPECIES: CCA tRNA nucleotidyltransferase [unclassified Helicobacter]|uniref:CCA tRNA nucleotidyltransferase n=1 Tax=unclassified Helicobacter TaxID=2593540 RepID=UPI000CF0D461|nr:MULTISPECIES: hypothetical protein [unclassified Helicobacter]